MLVFFLAGGTTWVLIQLGLIRGSWSDKLFTILTGLGAAAAALLTIFGIFQFILSLIPSTSKSSTTSLPPSFTIQNIIQAPVSPSPPSDKPAYRGIVGLPPPSDPKTIQQREQTVKDVYHKLIQPNITAIALTGIGGVGKSTLAALICRYAEGQRRAGKGLFTADPL